MSVTIVKTKPKIKPKTKNNSNINELVKCGVPLEVIDAYAFLKAKISKQEEKIAPMKKEFSKLEGEILEKVGNSIKDSESTELTGESFTIELSPKGKRTDVTDTKLAKKLLGKKLFMQLVGLKIKDLKDYLSPDEVSKVTKVVHANKRKIKVVKLASKK